MASLFFNTQERSIKELFHDPIDYDYHTLLLFLIIYYFLACLTFGVCVPSGAMVPSLVIGKNFLWIFINTGVFFSILLRNFDVFCIFESSYYFYEKIIETEKTEKIENRKTEIINNYKYL